MELDNEESVFGNQESVVGAFAIRNRSLWLLSNVSLGPCFFRLQALRAFAIWQSSGCAHLFQGGPPARHT